MRTTKFRDILWAVAYKTGQDPQQGDFLTNQAIPVGHSISQWVRRLWPSRDWPEWTFTIPFPPLNHIVPYDLVPVSDVAPTPRIGKVFEVYLVDPASTFAPVATDHRLTPNGIHVGFDHGNNVWVKFTPPPPVFTAKVWAADDTFNRDEVTYLDRTGECYRSRFNGNKGHEPAPYVVDDGGFHHAPPSSEIVQEAESGQRGSPVQPRVYDVFHEVSTDSLSTGSSFFEVFSLAGDELASVTHTHVPGDTRQSIVTSLYNSLLTRPGLASFLIILDIGTLRIRLSDNSEYQVAGHAGWISQFGIATVDRSVLVSSYNPGITPSSATPQKTEFTFTTDHLVAGAIYTFNIVDQAGVPHSFQYTALDDDSMETVLDGLSQAMTDAVATDDYFANVSVITDHGSLKFTVNTPPASAEADITLPGQPYWEFVPFPTALADAVIRGAVADLNKEWGQTQEGVYEEQAVPVELGTEADKFIHKSTPSLTDQPEQRSRYKL